MTASPHISIVLSDRSWILERLGTEIQKRIERVSLNDRGDPSADINYFITFACRKEKMPTLEMAWFAHMEQAPHLQELFYHVARDIDLPVTHSRLYRDMLISAGIENAIAIPPGVDHDRFQPKLRIGVVGRTYHTGRKGEALVSQLMDMPGIDWHFTGSGWPLPGKFQTDEELPDFYRSMDYILVPALYEGGPMCVPEALAVGTPVIASNVGWVSEFPHIAFENNNAEDLRRVLTDLLQQKVLLQKTTTEYTWDQFASAHDKAFHQLVNMAGKPGRRIYYPQKTKAEFSEKVRLLLHGNEATTLGGPSVRVPRTAEALQSLGIPAKVSTFSTNISIEEDVVHLFNVWSPHTALHAMRHLKKEGKTVVFSPIYLDLGERDFWADQLPQLAVTDETSSLLETYARAKAHRKRRGRLSEAVPGYNAMVREMINSADHVILLSQNERDALSEIGATIEDSRVSFVRNPVDVDLWNGGDPSLFRDKWLKDLDGPEDYIICIGRIEERKNQLLLARAVRDLPLRLVLVGHEGNPAYARKIRELGGDQVLMVGRLEPGSEMMRSALAGARAFALPSWSEGASLAALEAAAAGANLVLSDRSSEREYFGDLATYCDPGDPNSLRAAINSAMAIPAPARRATALQARVREHNSWTRYALDTSKAYAQAFRTPARRPTPRQPQAKPDLVFDITTLAHHKGRITGISRVESILAREFRNISDRIRFICWNDSIHRFIDVPQKFARFDQAIKYRSQFDNRPDTPAAKIDPGSTVFVTGSAWMQNEKYVRGLEQLKLSSGCGLITQFHDLIPFKFPFWFGEGYAPVFRRNFKRLASICDHLIASSQSCATDIRLALSAENVPVTDITTVRLGDPVFDAALHDPGPVRAQFGDRKFVLAVGAIHSRKNYEILYKVWARFADEQKHSDLHLVIVGGAAWNGTPLAERIAADPRVNKRIHVIGGIEDGDLAWLYQKCLFTVFPSLYEGWGLPVAESLANNKLCLATSSSSVIEIAPDFVEHIDPEDFLGWHQKISFYASSASARAAREESIRTGYKLVPWAKTAEDILDIVGRSYVRRGLQKAMAGQVISAGIEMPPRSLSFSENWHRAETWGRWSASSHCSVTFNVGQLHRHQNADVIVLLKQRVHIQHNAEKNYTVSIGGKISYQQRFTAKSFPQQLLLRIPLSAIDESGLVKIDFECPTSPEHTNVSKNTRSLGIGISSIVVLDQDWSNPLQSLDHSEQWFDGSRPARIDFFLEKHRELAAPTLPFSSVWGLGSTQAEFNLTIPIVSAAVDQKATIYYRAVASRESPVTIEIFCNGEKVSAVTHDDDETQQLGLDLPIELLSRASPVVLTFTTDSLLTPADLDLGSDRSLVGVTLHGLDFEPMEAKQ